MVTKTEMKARTKKFALKVINFVGELPKNSANYVMGKQLLRCGTSVGANYRSSCKAKSKQDFISKTSIVEEEADEAGYWLELLVESGAVKQENAAALMDEASRITAIMVASIKTARSGN